MAGITAAQVIGAPLAAALLQMDVSTWAAGLQPTGGWGFLLLDSACLPAALCVSNGQPLRLLAAVQPAVAAWHPAALKRAQIHDPSPEVSLALPQGIAGLEAWRWLFIIEGIPAVLLGFYWW